MTLVLRNANSSKIEEFAWSKEAVKHLIAMGAKPSSAPTSPLATKVIFEVADPLSAKRELRKSGVI